MTEVHDATRRQQIAAQPSVSTWLSANAGSGKTRVLTDRVARLLLEGVQPQNVLCLTYTKAAASEMQNRLFARLGAWSMLDDRKLEQALAELGLEKRPTSEDLRNARTLFARAIETPGGLKIQTIHSFCATLLRKFPLEAGVSPNFVEIEDRAADLLRAELIDQLADGPDATAMADLARQYTGADISSLTKEIVSNRRIFTDLSIQDALNLFGQPPSLTRENIIADTFLPGDWEMIQELIPVLLEQSTNDIKLGKKLQTLKALDYNALPVLASEFLYKTGPNAGHPKIDALPTKDSRAAASHLMPGFNALMQRIFDAKEPVLALDAAEYTVTLHRFARAFLKLYETAKQARGWLDFDDLILRARRLLADSDAADWVLYRMDGAIDHILVDEAQDTSPAQWDIILKLAEEFASGLGSRSEQTRTIFVVGDKKQSIYSFQGADPHEFDRIKSELGSGLAHANQTFQDLTLDYSFRSSSAILDLVDSMFEDSAAAGFDQENKHIAYKSDLPGRVDLWPVVPKPEKEDKGNWFDPVDRRSPEHEHRKLARAIAGQIKKMIDTETLIQDDKIPRPVQPRDFLILVQRRSGIFGDIIRACKESGLPIAGSDRLKVGAEIAVRDLGSLLSFLATPEDSLSLAAALRSPLFGWTEQQLFTLAHHRETEHLWPALRDRAEEFPDTVPILRDLRANADFLRPYDLIERMLTRHGGRKRFLARLGEEAEEGINALLSQALAYERMSVPSLTGFLTWMQTDDLEIKRQIDSASNQVRVMTVHGAKGLESPVVILPECGKRVFRTTSDIVTIKNTPVWRMSADRQPVAMKTQVDSNKEAQKEENKRLLYVALTRAKNWLIVAATGDLSKDGTDWWQQVDAGMRKGETSELSTPVGSGLRKEFGSWQFEMPASNDSPVAKPPCLPEVFRRTAPEPEPAPTKLSPSDLGGAKALPGEGLDEDAAKTYGNLVHALLETLPSLEEAFWINASTQISESVRLPDVLRLRATEEAIAVLRDPSFASIFFDSVALAEVSITANLGTHRLHGTIDRLILDADTARIIDFKTNRIVPTDPKSCPEGILRQMGAYAVAVQNVYPDRKILLDILWTQSGHLMRLQHDIVLDALNRSPYLDDAPMRS